MLILAKDIHASRVNVRGNDFTAGIPGPMIFMGLANAIAREVGLPSWSIPIQPILHSIHVSDGRTKSEMINKGGKFSPKEIPEDFTATINMSLLLNLPDSDDYEVSDVRKSFLRKRIGGGIMSNTPEVLDVAPDSNVYRQINRGWVLLPAEREERRHVSNGEKDNLTDIANRLLVDRYLPKTEDSKPFGLPVPISVGYRLLENPTTVNPRRNTRDKTVPHVFAEPLLGIGELVSVKNPIMADLSADEMLGKFWSWKCDGDYVLAHQNYYHLDAPKNTVAAE